VRFVKISGFTFIRNGNVLGYPFVPAIRSLLPLCDEMIVNVPQSTDGTLESVQAIEDPRISIVQSEWDETQRRDGLALSHHTNLALERCTGDWCIYIQGDEVLHEAGIPALRASLETELNRPAVQGLLVNYTHFYGSYWTYACSFGWYQQEVRVVRRDPAIRSRGDAQGFRTTDGRKLRVKNSGAHYYHYGHALSPELARLKLRNLSSLWHDDAAVEKICKRPAGFYEEDQKVKPFTGAHPAAMREIVARADRAYTSPNPVIRFRRKYFWKDLALLLQSCTGITIGVHRNYRLIR
jgi:hypothetical protein